VEYVGTDIATDFNRLATDPQMKYFWDMSREYQEPMYFHEPHEWWSRLDELFHA
jgi:L-rhamnose mutarotase